MPDAALTPSRSESRWLSWGRSAFATAITLVLVGLGIANIATRARWNEVEDGVNWDVRPEGVSAIDVAAGSAGARAGIAAGDILLAVNGRPVNTRGDVRAFLNGAGSQEPLSYTLLRFGSRQTLDIALEPATPSGSMYYVLAGVGLFTLLMGVSVRLRRPRDQATLHFFWLCVAFFGVFTLSFNGPFDRLDWTFFWGDAVATALLPPLLLHFTLVFPDRPSLGGARVRTLLPVMYLPALALILARVVVIARGSADGPAFSRALELLNRAEHVYLFLCAVGAAAVLVRAFGEIDSLTGRRQLRWIAWGTILGVGPFSLAYALPWAFGADPPLAFQFTAIPLGLVPLAFACAIVRYRLRDVEVIIKRGLAYSAFLGASIALYLAMRRLAAFAFANDADAHTGIVAMLATLVATTIAARCSGSRAI
jgi:two-component system NtrC family sensor kinase